MTSKQKIELLIECLGENEKFLRGVEHEMGQTVRRAVVQHLETIAYKSWPVRKEET